MKTYNYFGMKRICQLFAAIIGIATMGCSREELPNQICDYSQQEDLIIEASLAESTQTKTIRKEDGYVYWRPGDAINVFFGNDKGKFISTNTTDATQASFSGSLTITSVIGLSEGVEDNNYLWGLYPYDENATFNGTAITTNLSNMQTGVAGSFANGSYITLARNNSFGLSFYNVLAGFKLSLTRNDIKSISFFGNRGEILTGKISVGFYEKESSSMFEKGKPYLASVEGNNRYIKLEPEGEHFQNGEDYYFLFVPTKFYSGFSVILTTTDGKEGLFKYSGNRSFARNVFVNKSNIDDNITFVNAEKVDIPDTGFWSYCITYYDQNQDNEISIYEAEAITYIDCSGWSVKSLEGLSSFKNLKTLYCSDNPISAIDVSENVNLTTLECDNCNIETIDVSKNINLWALSCTNNPNLKEIWLGPDQEIEYLFFDEGITTIKRHIKVPTTVGIPTNEIWYTSQTGQAITPESVDYGFKTALGADCPVITSNSYSDGLGKYRMQNPWDVYASKVASQAFGYNSQLKTIILPEGLFGLEDIAFAHSNYLSGIILPSTVKEIGSSIFDECYALKTLVIFATTPPSLGSLEGSDPLDNLKIYVPQESINAYKQANGWSTHASKIFPISVSESKILNWELGGE